MPPGGKNVWREDTGRYHRALLMLYMARKVFHLYRAGYSSLNGMKDPLPSKAAMQEPASMPSDFQWLTLDTILEFLQFMFPWEKLKSAEWISVCNPIFSNEVDKLDQRMEILLMLGIAGRRNC